MVKSRGIEINIISQFDVCKLPEYKHIAASAETGNDPFFAAAPRRTLAISPPPPYPIASCCVPSYPGSQIWFEYTIDGPHPPDAIYFFKLTINDVVVTGWDCTAKHGFHGKMMYNLVSEGLQLFQRQSLRFGDGIESRDLTDVVQVNVYRVAKRARMRNIDDGTGKVDIRRVRADGLR
jgi:hypothetical protein